MGTNVQVNASINLDDQQSPAAAFEEMRPAIAALSQTELVQINLEVTPCVALVLAAWPEIERTAAAASWMPRSIVACVGELPACAHALSYAQSRFEGTAARRDDLPALAREAMGLRERFIADLRNLVAQDALDATVIDDYQGTTGFNGVIADLRRCVGAYSNHWDKIQGRSCRTEPEIDRAAALYSRMEFLVGQRELGQRTHEHWADLRDRAYALLLKRYDEARRVVTFVRWHEGDADKIAPSLWAGHGGRRKKSRKQAEAAVTPALAMAAPAETPALANAPAASGDAPFAQRVTANGVSNSPFMR